MNSPAALYGEAGRYAEAEPLFVQVLALSREVQGERHPADTIGSMNDLATHYSQTGRYAEAEPLYVQTLALRSEVLGEHHPDTLPVAGLDRKRGPVYGRKCEPSVQRVRSGGARPIQVEAEPRP